MTRTLMLLAAFVLLFGQVLAQGNRTVTGKVSDDKGIPLVGVTVSAVGSSQRTMTGADGNFSIQVSDQVKTLRLSYVGFRMQDVNISGKNAVDVSLVAENNELEGVVVTGYSREKKGQFVGAASVISGKAVETVPVGAFDQALQGRAPGMLVNSGSGQPGTSANVTIRGIQSIQGSGAQPLYIIDGIPMPAADMQTINPNDFETITVLKDAGAAALYGARAGTGVIVITTKKGKSGATNFTYRSQVGITAPPDFSRMNMMNTSEILTYEERLQIPNTPGWVYSPNNTASPLSVAQRAAILDSIRGINSDWRDVLYREGWSQLHELNMTGGTDRTRLFLSASYFDQEGIDKGSALKRYTTRFNIDHGTAKLNIQWNTTAGFSKTDFSEGEWLNNSPRNPFQMTFRAKPYENPYKADGSLNFGASTPLNLKQVANLLEGIENTKFTQRQLKVNSGLTLTYRIHPLVTLKNTVGIDLANDIWQRFVEPGSYYGTLQQFNKGINIEANKLTTNLINTTSAVFAKRFNNIHDVEAGAYFEVVRGYQKALGFTQFGLDPRISETGQGAGPLPVNPGQTTYPQVSTSAKSGYGIRSYFATGRYTYNNKYTLNASIRRDGTSRILNEDNREVTTWAAGASWNAMQENFMKNQNILTDLRVRLSYGAVPNIGSIPTTTYGIVTQASSGNWVSVTNYTGSQLASYSTTGSPFNPTPNYAGSSVPGQYPNTPGNPDLKIETIEKLNLGVDFAVWKNRARFTIDVYNNRTKDLFVRQPLSSTTGFLNLDINAGVMTNKGIEFAANVDVVRTSNIDVTLGWNHAINKNNIEDLGSVSEYPLGTFIIKEGLPFGSHYTFRYLGADPTNGRPRYETQAGGVTNDIGQAGRFYDFGTYLPKHVGGLTADVRWKNLTVSALFSYQLDVVRSNNHENWTTQGTIGFHQAVNANRRLLTEQWQKPGDNAWFQAPAFDRGFTSSDLQDAKFIRFRNLNVAYRIPVGQINGTTIIRSIRIYGQAQN
ncbi:MAG: hypothetical protein K0Q66_1230, partial [Chitinophagaceae bacterium]|nr:hypothetical protein [Chitinophagaceae bacterium]